MSDDAMGLKQRELLMEMREDIKGLRTSVDAIARDQALGVGMRGRGDIAGRVRKTGRGERISAEAIGVTVRVVDGGMLSTIRRSA